MVLTAGRLRDTTPSVSGVSIVIVMRTISEHGTLGGRATACATFIPGSNSGA